MPQYKKVFDAGLYSSGGGFTRVGVPTLRNVGSGGKQVAKSLRFRAANTPSLSRTFGTPTNNKKFTFSFWYKRGSKIGTATSDYVLTTSNAGANTAGYVYITADTLEYWDYNNATQGNILVCSILRKDPSAWMHIVLRVDYANATASNRAIFYVDGIAQTYSSTSYPLTTETPYINTSGVLHYISANGGYLDGYLADVNFIDGQTYDPTYFGEYNSDNIWVPKAYSGSYTGNSFYLPFTDTTSTTTLVSDSSGRGNNWSASGISLTSGTTYDSMYDSPTDYDNGVYGAGNYPTLNPLSFNSSNVVDGNLAYLGANLTSTRATFAMPTSGKWYWELTPVNASPNYIGFGLMGLSTTGATNFGNVAANSWGIYPTTNMFLSINGSSVATGIATPGLGVVFAAAYDAGTGNFWIGYSSSGSGSPTWFNSTGGTTGNPATGANPMATIAAQTLFPAVSGNNTTTDKAAINFGQRSFALTVPSGFSALNTKNITRPTDANMWFYGDTPDLVWIKNRTTTATSYSITDTVRGVGLSLFSNSTSVQLGDQDIAELNKFGMTVIGASSRTTASANNFVYWAWKGGGAATTNNSGSVTSSVSVNTATGFSIVKYNTGSSNTYNFGHGLGAIPQFIIIKGAYNSTAYNYDVYHVSIGPTYRLMLNLSDPRELTGYPWNNQTPSSSLVYQNNTSGAWYGFNKDCIAYCWTPISGYSSFGSYTGNGNASGDGPFIFTNFRPKYLLIKSSTQTASNWIVMDSARNTYNVANNYLMPSSSTNEAQYDIVDFCANGFKIKALNGTITNNSGDTYVYAAFAEYPFKIARAR